MRENELKPQFVMVIGGAGSGKNYFIEHHTVYSTYKLIDVDVIKGELGVSAAISQVKPMLLSAFKNHENIVHPSTAVNIKAAQNKIASAHQHGYNVTLILIATPPDLAVDQVRTRVRQGGHDVAIDNIILSNKKARESFDILSALVDSTKVVTN